jgi:hypothetical protein
MYNVGQADNLISPGTGSVSMPSYTNGCLSLDQYPCKYKNPNLHSKPKQIQTEINNFGDYGDVYDSTYPKTETENYEENTQHKQAGEIEDKHLFLIMFILLVVGIALVYINMKYMN